MKSRTAKEDCFVTHDGETLFYRHWPALSATAKGAVILLHRGHEHSGRMAHLVHELNLPDFAFFAWDARGHGRSPGRRGFSPGAAAAVRDLQCFASYICAQHDIEEKNIVVLAQSVGAVLAAAWAHDYAPQIAGMVLAAPAFKVKLYLPLARPALRFARRLRGDFAINSYVKARLLTHDKDRRTSYKNDPLISRAISVNFLLELHDLAARVVEDAAAITVPTQLLISGNDWVVEEAPQQRFFERLGSTCKEKHRFAGLYHDTLGERDRSPTVLAARIFILRCFDARAEPPDLLDADKDGFTRVEADYLARPLPALSPRGLYWRATRLALRVGAGLSKGIRIGRATGFDSGSMLDYVYQNRPQGRTVLGRALDRAYLNSIGWLGIRRRKVHLEELLGSAIHRLQSTGAPLRILDIAAGHGRYVLDAVEQQGIRPASILLRDFSDLNVTEGQRLIRQKELSDVAAFEQGDAFDGDELARIEPRPSIAIVSGLYELFSDNAMVRRSLAGLSAAVQEGGYLIYTSQPWHPQIELIARALTSHRAGRPWVMRRRSQVEMDQLVAAAGFRKLDQRIDPWGIFTVSLARREPA